MYKDGGILFFYTETPLHAGMGASTGVIDLPVQRERATQYPMVQGSGVKGSLRYLAAEKLGVTALRREIALLEKRKSQGDAVAALLAQKRSDLKSRNSAIVATFGPDPEDNGPAHGGALSFSDARILLFPVRSLSGVFAWITSPAVLHRLQRDATRCGLTLWQNKQTGHEADLLSDALPHVPPQTALVSTASPLIMERGAQKKVVLEEFAFTAESHGQVDAIAAWLRDHMFPQDETGQTAREYRYLQDLMAQPVNSSEEKIKSTLVILDDESFRQFTVLATEVNTRIRINPLTGTVETGALWTEECVPAEALLYSLMLASAPRTAPEALPAELQGANSCGSARSVVHYLQTHVFGAGMLQMGGDETVGRGFVGLRFNPGRTV
ncbi:type III-B CRISPR module RAMP protein Cmr4 [Heliophilum fasciatum]|uniref:CRISPR-associated protein Cmr4 n=1 Tax=Heliophilum fasciatum TaxID=35700 RepID=A0A4R2RDC3_9FIRM|nr:type III-B CRISPR module RAMP protein Cmr4 [Heliophilum fasciatum]MCW2279327.1 CRISPR-associated protein Cmr4 [Heliophilum fasciatum]TCP60308.1 CRISPR-associated protein Cmr4 [Heliophilum fasciatum]